MRVLLKDKNDGTLFVVEVMDVRYIPEQKTLELNDCTENRFNVLDISEDKAKEIIRTLYFDGKKNLSDYPAIADIS